MAASINENQTAPDDHTVTCAMDDFRARRLRTDGLVALLHGRGELRGAYAPADYLDQAVRWGA